MRSEGKDPELWNIATDGVINQFLKRDGLKMAKGGVDMAEAINYDAEQLYENYYKKSNKDNSNNKMDRVMVKINKVINNKISNKVVAVDRVVMVNNNHNHNNRVVIHKAKTNNKINKISNKAVVVDKVEITNNNHNLNNKVVLVEEVHKNKINNHKNKVVVDLAKIHRKKKNNKMLDMILTVCGNKQ